MDPITMTYYAAVCAALSAGAARLTALHLRLAVGAGVGLAAAAALPGLRAALGL